MIPTMTTAADVTDAAMTMILLLVLVANDAKGN